MCPPRGELAGAHLTAASGLPPVLEAFVHGEVSGPEPRSHPAIGNPRRQTLGVAGAPARAEDARPGARQAPGANRPSHSSASATACARAHDGLASRCAHRTQKRRVFVMRANFVSIQGSGTPPGLLMRLGVDDDVPRPGQGDGVRRSPVPSAQAEEP